MDKENTPIHVESLRDVQDHLEDFHSRLSQVEHVQDQHANRISTMESVLESHVLIVKDIEALQQCFSDSQKNMSAMESRITGHLGTINRVVLGNAAAQKMTQHIIGVLCVVVVVFGIAGVVIALN